MTCPRPLGEKVKKLVSKPRTLAAFEPPCSETPPAILRDPFPAAHGYCAALKPFLSLSGVGTVGGQGVPREASSPGDAKWRSTLTLALKIRSLN